jgi:hypothetical protein
MILTGQQREILKEGILGAYPTEDELKILLSEKMDLRYSAVAKGEDYISRVAFLVEKLEADGEVEQLIRVVVEKKPNSPYLEQVKTEFANVNNAKIAPQPSSKKTLPVNMIFSDDSQGATIGNYTPNAQGSIIISGGDFFGGTFIGTQINPLRPLPPTGTPSNLPSSGTSFFVGRDETLKRVHEQLQKSNQLAICAVSGMGGIGKTELAVQYATRHKDNYSGGLCWLQCRAGDVGTQIVNFALSRLGLTIPKGLEPPDRIGYCWQHWKEGQVLLIYDDVTDYQEIASLLPPRDMSRFKVLLTSRQRAGANYSRIDLDVLDGNSSLELLRSLVGGERIDAELDRAKALCAWLGYLPLGL